MLEDVISGIAAHDTYPNCNEFVLRLIVSQLDILRPSSTKARETFASFLKNGSISMKLACLSRLKSVFREPQAGHEVHEWGIPLLVREISIAARLTSVVVDILYENTMDVREVECLIQNLKENKECVEVLTRLDEARLLIYRLISTGDGFALFDELGDYLTNEFKSFMVMTKIEGNLVDVSYL